MTVVHLTHIGGPTTLIEVGGRRILTDPTFDPPGRTYRFGWGTSSRKTAGPAVPPVDLGRIDAVLLTHDHHADNLDDAGRDLLANVPVVVTTVAGARRLGGDARGLDPWDVTTLEHPGDRTVTLTATPCRHGPPGSRRVVGDVIGFALEWEGQRHGALWVTGDTVLYPGLKRVADRIRVGTAVVHLGRVRFRSTGPLRYTMGIRDAIELCRLIEPRTVVPVHYEGWTHFAEGRRRIESGLAGAPDVARRVVWAPIGAPVTLEA